MKNPWMKKNPLLSMWLSGANSVAGTARARTSAQAKRQAKTMLADGTRQAMEFWTGGLLAPTRAKKKKKK